MSMGQDERDEVEKLADWVAALAEQTSMFGPNARKVLEQAAVQLRRIPGLEEDLRVAHEENDRVACLLGISERDTDEALSQRDGFVKERDGALAERDGWQLASKRNYAAIQQLRAEVEQLRGEIPKPRTRR